MALSNWETAAWDKNGNPMPGILTVGSISIEIVATKIGECRPTILERMLSK